METESTACDVYDEIAELVAAARTKALVGERMEALGLLRRAALELARWSEMLAAVPGYCALRRAFGVAREALGEEDIEETATFEPVRRAA